MSANTFQANDKRATLTVKEAAVVLGMSVSSAYEAIKNGSFPVSVLEINGRIYIPRAALEAALGGAVLGDSAGRIYAEAEARVRTLRDELFTLSRHVEAELARLDALLGPEYMASSEHPSRADVGALARTTRSRGTGRMAV